MEHIEQATAAPGERRRILSAPKFGKALVDAGVVSDRTKHVVIECGVDGTVQVTTWEIADERLLDVDLTEIAESQP